jgi:hypothetical protein
MAVSHLTLTFDSRRHGMSVEGALFMWRRLVQQLNEDLGGHAYRDKWGHCYFGYLVGVEFHKSGVVHLHVVVDNWIDYRRVHAWWNEFCGFAWIKQLDDGGLAALKYVVKYVMKSDQAPSVWLQRRRREVVRGRIEQDELERLPRPSRSGPAKSAGSVKAGHPGHPKGAGVPPAALTASGGGEHEGRQGQLL